MSFSIGASPYGMTQPNNKTVTIVGATGALGHELVRTVRDTGASVIAVARNTTALTELAAEFPGIDTIAADATDEHAPERVFSKGVPDVLILSLGAPPPVETIGEQRWSEFSQPWNVDVRASFFFGQAALLRPLVPGSTVILISSGAGLGGSPVSGGYAGAKRMQMFLADYLQEESDRLRLGVRFIAVAPARIMPGTPLGAKAVAAYARYRGITEAEFIERSNSVLTTEQVAQACVQLAGETSPRQGNVFAVSPTGIEEVAS